MSYDIADKILQKWKTNRKETLILIILTIALVAVIAYVAAFSTEKATQHAASPPQAQKDPYKPPATPDQQTRREENRGKVSLEQETHGDQSPAIVTNDNVTIVYEGEKGNQ